MKTVRLFSQTKRHYRILPQYPIIGQNREDSLKYASRNVKKRDVRFLAVSVLLMENR
jgi:hypothetical protein